MKDSFCFIKAVRDSSFACPPTWPIKAYQCGKFHEMETFNAPCSTKSCFYSILLKVKANFLKKLVVNGGRGGLYAI